MYVVSDQKEVSLANRIKNIPDYDKRLIGFFIYNKDGRILIAIAIGAVNGSSFSNEYLENSNRYILIEDRLYPLSFDYDDDFGTRTPIEDLGEFGNREGSYMRSITLAESTVTELKSR